MSELGRILDRVRQDRTAQRQTDTDAPTVNPAHWDGTKPATVVNPNAAPAPPAPEKRTT